LCVGIFRDALVEMIKDIETLNDRYDSLPLILKLSAYKRSFLMKGLSKDKRANPELKLKGENILKALHMYKDKINPTAFEGTDFKDFVNDPMGLKNQEDEETKM
jgi:hypothetical protein